ncbi:MAG: type IV secretion protein IcmO [Micavibrio aeruginosavorus]|uniref:Type IV secretion protein IcmO n=1 Tax=Micavibrio aeruginosavorus TaxID=349221 RepID=A0A2W5PPN0_9BACT|nr:MAG: type IV secretion protein IcmO [Micavibrio aeruginosavorus]
MAINEKKLGYYKGLRDVRPVYQRLAEGLSKPRNSFLVFFMMLLPFYFVPSMRQFADLILLINTGFFWWLYKRKRPIPFKLPMDSKFLDHNNMNAGRKGKPEGILYLGNTRGPNNTGEEIWFSNSDARTHLLYLGTTGAGKTEGLKSIVTNALTWGSGFVYIDGKADTDLWSSLSSLVRRFGRDDDLFVLNYMTGNSDARAPSNTMNPFSSGSASYLTNMLVSLMPQAEGDNAMWKERAVSLISSLMPALTWKRDNQDIPLSVSSIRSYLDLNNVIKLSRDDAIPSHMRESVAGYLNTLPGYVDAAFDDNGKEKPMGPDQPMIDTTTVRQQHGYLTMQFTRSLQSLGDDYGYIFDTQAADVDMVDIVLNRRILIVLIPALEKSSDETANLGKIVAATIKGMMGSTLGATVEGESSSVIENKPTHSATPFMTIFDEVGYYVSDGMAVMAAQARSLGFSLVFSAQDLPALQKRVKEESRSITGNCNIKIFGKLSDPTDTKDYFERQAGKAVVVQTTGFQLHGGVSTGNFIDNQGASITAIDRADYGDLKKLREGEAVLIFEGTVIDVQIFYSNPGHAKAMRVGRFLSLPPGDEHVMRHRSHITKLRDYMVSKTWTAAKADVKVAVSQPIEAMRDGLNIAKETAKSGVEKGIAAVAEIHACQFPHEAAKALESDATAPAPPPPLTATKPGAQSAPVAPMPPVSAPPKAPAVTGGPMGFFKKAPEGENTPAPETPAPVAAIEPVRENKKVSWNDLIAEETAAASIEKVKLDSKAEKILEDAGAGVAAALFGKDE